MSNSNVNAGLNNVRWFNAHTEACGYLNGLKEVSPQSGQDFKPFWSSTFCMLEGNPEKPKKTYISVTIANPKIVELLKPYENHMNSGESKVFVTARVADLSVEPFTYPANSPSAGKLGVNWKGKVIQLIALKIGDMTIDLKKETTTDLGVPAGRAAPSQPAAQQQNSQDKQSLFDKPLVVVLEKNEPNFNETKDRLKQSGYRWNNEKSAWYLSSVKLSKDDPLFQQKYAELKSLGYCYSKDDQAWTMPAAPKQQGGYQQFKGGQQNNRQGNQSHTRHH